MRWWISFLLLSLLISCEDAPSDLAGLPIDVTSVAGVIAVDELNSVNAAVLIDGAEGTSDATAWNPGWYASTKFPMRAYIDFGKSYDITAINYFMGNYQQGQQALALYVAPDDGGSPGAWQSVGVSDGEAWNAWVNYPVNITGRYVRLEFSSFQKKFNISELTIEGTPEDDTPPSPEPPTDPSPPDPSPPDPAPNPDPTPDPAPNPDPVPNPAPNPNPEDTLKPRAGLPGELGVSLSYYYQNPNKWQHANADCTRLHDRFWTQAPDGKAYPTWHPPFYTDEDGTYCEFGHEHGDNPGESVFYREAERYQALWDDGALPLAFGYASEVLAANNPTGHRHEDHVGHKVYWEHFEAAYGNGANPGTIKGSGIICDALLKMHQGTHSADAFANHLHEMVTHFDCSDGSEIHVTLLSPLGRPGWFTNACEFNGALNPENNTRALFNMPMRSKPVATREAPTFVTDTYNPLSGSLGDLHGPDGERSIPGAGCVHTWNTDGYKATYGHSMMEAWTVPVYISSPGQDAIVKFRPYISVLNPARVHDGTRLTRTLDACREAPQNGMRRSSLCEDAMAADVSDWQAEASPYNGSVRNVNFKGLHINNANGDAEVVTDAFGRLQTGAYDPAKSIKQYIAPLTNDFYRSGSGVNHPGILASLPVAGSNEICTRGGVGAKQTCSGDGLKFAVEWFRDYSDTPGLHAPN